MNSFDKKRIKICFLLPSLDVGGAERVAISILRNLNPEKYDLHLLVFGTRNGGLVNMVPNYVQITSFEKQKVRYTVPQLLLYVWKLKPKFVFSNLSYLNLLVALIKPFFPKNCVVVARESNIASINVKRSKNSLLSYILYKYFLNNIDAIICQTEEMKQDLAFSFDLEKHKLRLIKNPVDFEFIEEKSCMPISLEDGFINIVACGRLTRQKGFDILLGSLTYLSDLNIQLWLIGDGELKETLVRYCKKLNLKNVHFLGFLENPYPYLRQADMFVLSSRYEGMPNVVLEAVALNTPVVATPAKGGVIDFIVSKKCGLVSKDMSPKGLSEIIRDCHRISGKFNVGPQFVNDHSAKIVTRLFEGILEELS